MKISNARRRAIQRLTAYTSFAWPREGAVSAFFAVTDSGASPSIGWRLNKEEGPQFKELLDAHSIQSRVPSPLLEGLWEEGHFAGDFSIGAVLLHYLMSDRETWFRRLPAYTRAYRLAVRLRGHAS